MQPFAVQRQEALRTGGEGELIREARDDPAYAQHGQGWARRNAAAGVVFYAESLGVVAPLWHHFYGEIQQCTASHSRWLL